MRSTAERRAAALAKLESDEDVWVATADATGRAHLVPLSLAWDGRRVVVATEARSLTARNAASTGRARLALGDTRDVVMVDVTVESVPVTDVDPSTAELFADRTGWDVRSGGDGWVFLLMTPERVQVWRDEPEVAGRTVMRHGAWLDDGE